MATNFPASLDTLTNPTSSDSLSSPSHSAQHANVNDAVEALQAKVGADSSAVTTSLDYKVAQLEAVSHGKILQVVSTTKTDIFSASVAQASSTAVTGLSVAITPSSASSTILVMAQVNADANSGTSTVEAPVAILTRGGSPICIGDAAGTRSRGTSGSGIPSTAYTPTAESPQSIGVLFVDSPATTSATTYAIELGHTRLGTATVVLNSGANTGLDRSDFWRTTSTITVMEVGP
jgi:hypothetical protein